jgi:ribosomal protein L7/L12
VSQKSDSADRGHSAGCTYQTGGRATGPIAAIQLYRELTGVGWVETKAVVDKL